MGKKNKQSSVAQKRKKRREALEFTLDLNVDFGENYGNVDVIKDKTVVMPERILDLRENVVRLLFTSIGQAVAMQPKVMREILPLPYNLASGVMKTASGTIATVQNISKPMGSIKRSTNKAQANSVKSGKSGKSGKSSAKRSTKRSS